MYISITLWRDLTDGHLYREGDHFPFDGREIPEARLKGLESGRNRAGLRLIQALDEEAEQTDAPKDETPEEASEGQEMASEPEKAEKPKRNRSGTK